MKERASHAGSGGKPGAVCYSRTIWQWSPWRPQARLGPRTTCTAAELTLMAPSRGPWGRHGKAPALDSRLPMPGQAHRPPEVSGWLQASRAVLQPQERLLSSWFPTIILL